MLKRENFAYSTLATAIALDSTEVQVFSGHGLRFPQDGSFIVVLYSMTVASAKADNDREIMELQWSSGDVFDIIERELEGTTAKTWAIGDNIENNLTAGQMDEITALAFLARLPVHYERDIVWAIKGMSVAADRYTLRSPNIMSVNINNEGYVLSVQTDIDLSTASNWDTTTPTNYTTAANRAGKDFYLYACQPASGTTPVLKLSANSTVPSGYEASNSRKIGGFHCLCVAVGTISGHTLTDFVAGDILPASIWDLKHKPKFASPEGMVFSTAANEWVDIYLPSGTGASTASVYGATITDTRNWMDFVDDGGAVKKRLLRDFEFQLIAAGSNEETNISGSADPVTTGGHSDTAGRRMISNIGVEDAVGALWQWLLDQSYFPYGGTGYWGNLPGGKGSLYTTFTADPGAPEVDNSDSGGDIKLLAGGAWDDGAAAGSRAHKASGYRWMAFSNNGGRFAAESL